MRSHATLRKLLELMSSPNEAEGNHVALQVARLMREQGVRFSDLLGPSASVGITERVVYRDRVVYKDRVVYRDKPVRGDDYMARAAECVLIVESIAELEEKLMGSTKLSLRCFDGVEPLRMSGAQILEAVGFASDVLDVMRTRRHR